MKKLQDIDLKGKYVVARVDFDDPINAQGELISDFRLRASLPTIEYLRERKAKQIVLVSKLGRPVSRKGETAANITKGNPTLTMEPVARRLREIIGRATDRISTRQVEDFPLQAYVIDRGLYLLDNIRFDWREGTNDPDFAKLLASLGDVYVFDAFAMVGSGEEASTVGVADHTEIVAGLRIQEEVESLGALTSNVKHPFVAVLGGSKTDRKIPVIEAMMGSVDTFLLGGVIANTFTKSQGVDVKNSVVDDSQLELANRLYKRDPNKFVIPKSFVWQGQKIMDIGEKAREEFAAKIATAKTVFWNGTLGVTSTSAQDFKFGSLAVANAMAKNRAATTIVSGGDTVALLEEQELDLGKYSFVSTGGGATLKYLAGELLPALKALDA